MVFTWSAYGNRKKLAFYHVGLAAGCARGHRRPSFRRSHRRGVCSRVALEQHETVTLASALSPWVESALFGTICLQLQEYL
jgi:hypothetical protein